MTNLVEQLATTAGVTPNVVWVMAALALALAAGSAVRLAILRRTVVPPSERQKRLGSLATWWVLFGLLAVVAALGAAAAVVVFAAVSLLGLREFCSLARDRIAPVRPWWRLVYLAMPVHYLFIALGWPDAVRAFIPVWVLVTLLVRLVVVGQTTGFLETVGITFLGLMLVGYLFSHAVLVLTLPGGGFGPFLFLLILTEGNDIAQALWGRHLGRHKITPTVSPNKTWEGFLLGMATTVTGSVVLAPLLTPFTPAVAVAAGALIAGGGFLGDITMSAVKREVGVKDAGTLLPGQGGVLDRIDSLTFTGPLFYYFAMLHERGTP